MMRSTTAAAFIALGLLLPAAAFAESGLEADGVCDVEATQTPELECLAIAGDYSVELYYGEFCERTLTLTNTCDVPVSIVEVDCEPDACVSATLEPGDELELDMQLPEAYDYDNESSRSFEASTDTLESTLEVEIRNYYEAPEYPDEPPVDQGDEPDHDAGDSLDAGGDPDSGQGFDIGEAPDSGNDEGDADDSDGSGCSTSGNAPSSALLTLAGALGLIAVRRRR